MTLGQITNYLQEICHKGLAEKEVIFEDRNFQDRPVKEIAVFDGYPLQKIINEPEDKNKVVLKIF